MPLSRRIGRSMERRAKYAIGAGVRGHIRLSFKQCCHAFVAYWAAKNPC
jgi:hypothetical protein